MSVKNISKRDIKLTTMFWLLGLHIKSTSKRRQFFILWNFIEKVHQMMWIFFCWNYLVKVCESDVDFSLKHSLKGENSSMFCFLMHLYNFDIESTWFFCLIYFLSMLVCKLVQLSDDYFRTSPTMIITAIVWRSQMIYFFI